MGRACTALQADCSGGQGGKTPCKLQIGNQTLLEYTESDAIKALWIHGLDVTAASAQACQPDAEAVVRWKFSSTAKLYLTDTALRGGSAGVATNAEVFVAGAYQHVWLQIPQWLHRADALALHEAVHKPIAAHPHVAIVWYTVDGAAARRDATQACLQGLLLQFNLMGLPVQPSNRAAKSLCRQRL